MEGTTDSVVHGFDNDKWWCWLKRDILLVSTFTAARFWGNPMPETPKPFWYFVGTAVLILALAVSWRLVSGPGIFSLTAPSLSVSLNDAQQKVSQAQDTVTQVTQQAQDQQSEIAQLEQTVASQKARIQQLVSEIQNSAAAPTQLRATAQQALFAEQALRLPPRVQRVDPALLLRAQTQLQSARIAIQTLQQKSK